MTPDKHSDISAGADNPRAAYLDELNDQQRAAVEYTGGPQLVIAGAGSGKTRVLTYKILHLLTLGASPWRIMALTFTNKAAREMRDRIESLMGPKAASQLWMGTFHSIFARILRRHADLVGYKPSFTIYDAADSKALIKMIIKDMELDEKWYRPSTVAATISWAKNALISPEAYAANRELTEADSNGRRPRMAEIYAAYRDRCLVAGAMDFDDLLYYTNVLLRDNPEVRSHYAEYFSYILVDEYQDTNFAQHLIVQQLCEGRGNLTVVGDDAQSIYSFRGANITNILNLNRTFPDLSIFKLERNYRSTRTIIEAANSLIDKNRDQIPKKVFSLNEQGAPIELVEAFSDYEESFLVANRITRLKSGSTDSYEDFAILYRTNAQSRVLEEALRKQGIPYRIYGGLSFYQRKEVKDAVAYFRLSVNPDDDEALRRVINFPARGIGDTTLNRVTRAAIDSGVSLWQIISHPADYDTGLKSAALRKLDGFRGTVQVFIDANAGGMDAYELARRIITDTRMVSMLQTERTPENISRIENLQELINGARQFVEMAREEGSEAVTMADFLTDVSLATDQDRAEESLAPDDSPTPRVTLMTVHAAKGLEFGNVFIVGLEEELFPNQRASENPADLEEERRLLYVALTRAKRFCMLSYANQRFRNGMTNHTSPSRFLRDIDPRYLRPVGGASLPGRARFNPVERYRSSYHSPGATLPANTHRNEMPALSRIVMPSATPATSEARGTALQGASTHSASELAPGMRIEHTSFGHGTITEIDTSQSDARIHVDFDNTPAKVLMLKYARFVIRR